MESPLARAWVSGLSGIGAMPLSVLLFMPFHTVINNQYSTGASPAATVRALYRDGGAARFYRGVAFAAPMVVIKRFAETFMLENARARLWPARSGAGLGVGGGASACGASALAAALSAGLVQLLLMPLDTLKTCSQVFGGLHAFQMKALQQGRLIAFWTGAAAASMAAVVSSLAFWSVFTLLDSGAAPGVPVGSFGDKSTVAQLFRLAAIGFVAGVVADLAVNLLRWWKVRQQLDSGSPSGYIAMAQAEQGHTTAWELGLRTMPLRLLCRGFEGLVFSVAWKLILGALVVGHPASPVSTGPLLRSAGLAGRLMPATTPLSLVGNVSTLFASPSRPLPRVIDPMPHVANASALFASRNRYSPAAAMATPRCSMTCKLGEDTPRGLLAAGLPALSFVEAFDVFSDMASQFAGIAHARWPGERLSTILNTSTSTEGMVNFLGGHYLDFCSWHSAVQHVGLLEQRAIAKKAIPLARHTRETAKILGCASIFRDISTLYAARQAVVALGGLSGCGAKKVRADLRKQQASLHRLLTTSFPWQGRPRGPGIDAVLLAARDLGAELRQRLTSLEVADMLHRVSPCTVPFDPGPLVKALTLEQRALLQPPGRPTRESRLVARADASGRPLELPLLGLGTGFSDCLRGRLLETKNVDNGDGVGKQILELSVPHPVCSAEAPHGWASNFSLVDTAVLYGTEKSVGAALVASGRPRKDFFVITKPPVQEMWQILGVDRDANSYLTTQLSDLQTDYVDVFMYHHNRFDKQDWLAMEKALDQGRARALGSSHFDQARDAATCVLSGECKHLPMLVEEDWSPCVNSALPSTSLIDGKPQAILLAISTIHTCSGEPHVAKIARHLGTRSGAVAMRWAFQTGAPVLAQTDRADHLYQNAQAFDIELPLVDMGLLSLLPLLYRFGTDTSPFDRAMLRALGESPDPDAWGFVD